MESLAIIAFKQPVTRAELEAVRGVDSGGVLSTLMEKRFIKIAGRKEVPGRPVVYATTKEFLETFDLGDLSCLPPLKDIQKTEENDAAQARVQAQGNFAQGQQAGLFTSVETEAKADVVEAQAPDREATEDNSRSADVETEAKAGDVKAQAPDRQTPEDNSLGRDNIEEEGRGADSSGTGNGEPADDNGIGGKG
jgi:segregation and condensation protein B